ncbi:tryptophan--tRNA ligase, partial [Pseudoalteromonas sp. S2893]
MSIPVVFSGIQPTGGLSIGNDVGAISLWGKLREDEAWFFMLVELHA